MANIRPFKAFRPAKEYASQIAALPYDVYNRKEAKEEVIGKPNLFLNIDRPETQFEDTIDMYAPFVYEKARDLLAQMIYESKFIQEEQESYYLYELTMDGRSQTGIVACESIDDYLNGIVKKHENTREEKEKDRINHIHICSAQTGPIFLAYHEKHSITEFIEKKKRTDAPLYDFTTSDHIRHRVFRIFQSQDIEFLKNAFDQMQHVYIADGHHRAASAVKVGQMRRESHQNYTGEEEFNYFMAVLFADKELRIFDYNRVVKDLNHLTKDEFLEKLCEVAKVNMMEEMVEKPTEKRTFLMYIGEDWFRCKFKENVVSEDVVDKLDVSLLQNYVLDPILGIKDPKRDSRIDFVGGIRGLKALEKRVSEDCKVAFAMYPTSMEELFQVADQGRLMPPKSTWFEPKLRSGIFLHNIEK